MKVCIGSCTFCPGLLASAGEGGCGGVDPLKTRTPFAVLGSASGFCCALCAPGRGDMLRIMHGSHIGARNHRKLLQLCNQMCVKIV
jgi:hypothetical protein